MSIDVYVIPNGEGNDICYLALVKKENENGEFFVYDRGCLFAHFPEKYKNLNADDVLLSNSKWRPNRYCEFAPYLEFENDLVELLISESITRLKILTV